MTLGHSALRRNYGSFLTLICAYLAFMGHADPVDACGFHDPKLVAQGIMNHVYPNSLHVTGAIIQARAAGHLPPFDSIRLRLSGDERKRMDQIVFAKNMSALHALGTAIETRNEQGLQFGISLVILDTMLWSRFSSDYPDVRQGLHAKGPVVGDAVLVTGEPVVQSIQQGSMSIVRAINLGVMRIYASPHQREELIARFGSIGEAPLPRSRLSIPILSGPFDASTAAPAPSTNQGIDGPARFSGSD